MCRATIFLLLLSTGVFAQSGRYPQSYFRNPLRIPILLAGNFGECRPGHFHSGLDIKTGGHENEPVYAAADGYVSRIKMEPGGFGHGLYITHPNGYTTLYAHLNDFVPRIQQYVRAQQYAQESWTVDLKFLPEQFPVKKGEQIAWSGNTGGSTAPHLHFEIRDTKTEHPLNPQLFGFEIKDTLPPVPVQLAVYGKAVSTYEQDPVLLPLKLHDGAYHPAKDTVEVTAGIIPIGVEVNDFMNGSDNTLAYYTAEWYAGDDLQGRITLDDIGYDETRYLHAFADYKTKQRKGDWIQLLYCVPGNALSRIYSNLNVHNGAISPDTYGVIPVRIVLHDVAGNAASVGFWLRLVDGADTPPCAMPLVIKPLRIKSYESRACRFTIDETQLYDEVCGEVRTSPMQSSISERFSILSADIPAHHYYPLELHTKSVLPFTVRDKVAMMWSDGRDTTGRVAAALPNGWYSADVRQFGDFWLAIDTAAPILKPLSKIGGNMAAAKSIAFKVKDAVTSVKRFGGTIDGKWVLFEQHENVWTYVFDEHCGKGRHTLRVAARDELGNKVMKTFTFTR